MAKAAGRNAGAPERRRIVLNPKYAPLFDDACRARYFLVSGGRGSGKSFATSLAACRWLIRDGSRKNILYLRQTLVSAHISIIPEFHDKLELLGCGGLTRCGKTDIRYEPTGAMLFFRGIQTSRGSNEANLKSVKDVAAVLVDEAQELADEAAFDRIDLSLRDADAANRIVLSFNPTDKTHWLCKRFFERRGVPDGFNGTVGDACYIHTTYEDNREHLSADFLRLAEECRKTDEEKHRNIFLGFWRGDKTGALWTRGLIEPCRMERAPEKLDRIVVAVDPAVTGEKRSDETGIVVAGCRRAGGTTRYYVLADRSLRGSPDAWASAAANAYEEFEADRIVAEVNNGGDMVERMLRGVGRGISYRAVRATRGKLLRAEPVAALYERGIVHHVGRFPELERQMCNYAGTDREKSPDRMDALVWALTELSMRGEGSRAIMA